MVRKNEPVHPLPPVDPVACPQPQPVGPLVSVKSVNGMTGDVVLKELIIGDKHYNGSDQKTIYASDLGLGSAFVYQTSLATIAAVEQAMQDAEVGDVYFCREDKLFYLSVGEGEYKKFTSKAALDNALTKYALISETGNKIQLSVDETDWKVTAKLFDKNDNLLSSSTIDLPIEDLIKDAYYDDTKKAIIIVFYNGRQVEVPVSGLISGLVKQADFDAFKTVAQTHIDDTTVHVTSAEKEAIANAATKTWVNEQGFLKADALTNYYTKDETTAAIENHHDATKADVSSVYNKSEVDTKVNAKQDIISDLETIRSGASAGATAVQPAQMTSAIDTAVTETKTWVEDKHYLTEHQSLADYYKKSEVDTKVDAKQDILSAGANISISGNVISATDTTYTAGENVEITAENVINCIASSKLTAEITVANAVGAIQVGEVIAAGTSLEDIIKRMLSAPPTPTSTTLYYGATDNIPTGTDGLTTAMGVLVSTMKSGIDYTISAGNPVTEEGQYPVMACSTDYVLTDWKNKASGISYMSLVNSVVSGDKNIYYINNRVYNEDEGGELYTFIFTEA